MKVPVATSSPSSPSASFDQFRVDFTSGELIRSGVRVSIQGQPLHVLRLLLEAEGKVVTREELRQVCLAKTKSPFGINNIKKGM